MQAVYRGRLGKKEHRRVKKLAAVNSGVLVAMKGTRQGETGFYTNPLDPGKGQYYFEVADGQWTFVKEPPVAPPAEDAGLDRWGSQ